MSHFGSSVEYGLHCLLYLAGATCKEPATAKDLASFQGISPSYVAKLFTNLQRAGLVVSAEGAHGGFRLAKSADAITVDDVVIALEGSKPLFQCREIRRNCLLYDGKPPPWASDGVCAIHGLMLEAERNMREVLRTTTLGDLAGEVGSKVPDFFQHKTRNWFADRLKQRQQPRHVRKTSDSL